MRSASLVLVLSLLGALPLRAQAPSPVEEAVSLFVNACVLSEPPYSTLAKRARSMGYKASDDAWANGSGSITAAVVEDRVCLVETNSRIDSLIETLNATMAKIEPGFKVYPATGFGHRKTADGRDVAVSAETDGRKVRLSAAIIQW